MDAEFERWMEAQDFGIPSLHFPVSIERLASLLSAEEQAAICDAAWKMHHGYDIDAERTRERAGYGYSARVEDRERRGLPRRLA